MLYKKECFICMDLILSRLVMKGSLNCIKFYVIVIYIRFYIIKLSEIIIEFFLYRGGR